MTLTRHSVALLVATAIASLGGCGALPTGGSAPKPIQTPMGETGIATYIDTMQKLANSEPAQQADVFYEVERAYTGAPTTANTLRRAIALVTPGHPATNLPEGKKILEQLLANPERLTLAERNLASFLVKDADTRLQLQADIRRLTATVDERTQNRANSDRRVQMLQEEISKLRRTLEETQHKLDATISIEKSLSERSRPPPTGREASPRD